MKQFENWLEFEIEQVVKLFFFLLIGFSFI